MFFIFFVEIFWNRASRARAVGHRRRSAPPLSTAAPTRGVNPVHLLYFQKLQYILTLERHQPSNCFSPEA